jgi:hypothetical protein
VLPGVAWERGECYSTISGVHLLDNLFLFPFRDFCLFI